MKASSDELEAYYAAQKKRIYNSYLQSSTPWGQSGFSGPKRRWEACRKPIGQCVTRSGRFLDIGCANGYLLESLLRWTAERCLTIIPYGIDVVDDLVLLAKKRLPHYARNIEFADGFRWKPAILFDYVRTELCYVPPALQKAYVRRILTELLADGGTLLITEYRSTSDSQNIWQSDLLAEMGFTVSETRSGFWKGKELTRVSVLHLDSQWPIANG